jgi:tRNA (adenine57-N1/adenine58-N1)-methyltransferase
MEVQLATNGNSTPDNIIREGDAVIIYEDLSSLKLVVMKKGQMVNNRYGNFKHEDMINQQYGAKVHFSSPSPLTHLSRSSPSKASSMS